MPARTPHLVLMGLRASGKSTLGALLAQRGRLPFTDLDHETLSLLGHTSAAQAWAALGQHAFRNAETRALRATLALETRVIALGGGTPTAQGAADLLRDARHTRTALLIYLRYPAHTLRDRLASDPAALADRPALTGASPLDEIPDLLAQRDPLYLDLAELVLESPPSAQTAADAILDRVRTWTTS